MNSRIQFCTRTSVVFWLTLFSVTELPAQGPENALIRQPAQDIESHVPGDYDSLQDIRVERMESRLRQSMGVIQKEREIVSLRIDSMERMLEAQGSHVVRLEKSNRLQEELIEQMNDKITRQEEAAALYRDRFQKLLRWSVAGLLVLLTGAFVFLLIFSIRTRQLLLEKLRGVVEGTARSFHRLKRNQKKLREKLLTRMKAENRSMRSKIKAQERSVRRTARKEVRANFKSARR